MDEGVETPKVIFFSGKGGVGKTTLAGTAAISLVERHQRVLVASTDPAHSLSDLFERPIGGGGLEVIPGLEAIEVDAPGTVDKLLEGLGPAAQKGGAAAAADLLKLASNAPGVDEIVSLDLLLRLLETPRHDAVILDTAPTGHTLRLLSLPEVMDRYFGKLMMWRRQFSKLGKQLRRLLRSEDAMEPEELGEQLAGARGRMQMLAELLRDPARCSLVLVTIPEAMSVLETTRTFELLRGQDMPVAAIAVNMIQPVQAGCEYCSHRHASQMIHLEHIRELASDVPLILVEAEVEEPRGVESLSELATKIWSYRTVLD